MEQRPKYNITRRRFLRDLGIPAATSMAAQLPSSFLNPFIKSTVTPKTCGPES